MFLIAFETGFVAIRVIKKPTALEAKDFVIAYFLFSSSVFGVNEIAIGRTTLDKSKLAPAANKALLSEAKAKQDFKTLLL